MHNQLSTYGRLSTDTMYLPRICKMLPQWTALRVLNPVWTQHEIGSKCNEICLKLML